MGTDTMTYAPKFRAATRFDDDCTSIVQAENMADLDAAFQAEPRTFADAHHAHMQMIEEVLREQGLNFQNYDEFVEALKARRIPTQHSLEMWEDFTDGAKHRDR